MSAEKTSVLSVTLDHKGKSGFVPLNAKDILILEWASEIDRTIFHTDKKEIFYAAGSLKTYWVPTLEATGFKFIETDRNHAVDVRRIKWIDIGSMKQVYFSDDDKGLSCSIVTSPMKFNEKVKLLLEANPNIELRNHSFFSKYKWSISR